MRVPPSLSCVTLALLLALPAPASAAAPLTAFARKAAAVEEAMMADPSRALVLAREAARLAATEQGREKIVTAQATAKRLEAEALLGLNRLEEAAAPAAAADTLIAQVAPTSKLAGDIQRTRGAIAAMRGNVQEALRRYQATYRLYTANGDERARAIALLDIGQVYWDAGDYPRVLRYFDEAGELMEPDDANLLLALHNARGEVLRAMGRYGAAQGEYRAALAAASSIKSNLLSVRILNNLADAQARDGKLAAAAQTVGKAFALARNQDAAEWRPFIHAVAMQIAAARSDDAAALREAEATFAGQDLAKTAMPYREAHEVAAAVYERIGDQTLAMRHLRAFQRLDKEAQGLIATNAAQLMAAQFDFTNQNLRISQLKQGQLERDIRLERQRSRYRTNLLLGLLLAGATVLAIALYGFFSIRRSRNQVRAANTELAGTNQALEKALKAKSEFLATTSHEIRTPLNGIMGMTQVLLADPRIEPDVRERIAVVHGAGETMQALVDDLLDVAKLEHGELTLVCEPVDLDRMLADAVRLWRAPAETKGLAVTLRCQGLGEQVMTDGGRIRQILFNLLSNAVKFTPAGSVEVECQVTRQGGEDAALLMRVADTGIGIDPADHAAIFEAFTQVDGGTTRQFSGTGLGLSIVHSLVERLGGTVTVDSALGKGATFTVTLPVRVAAAAPASSGDANPGSGGLANAAVLLVDADPASRAMTAMMLAGEAASFDVAADIPGAIALIGSGAVDCTVVNVTAMGVEDGEGAAAVRALVEATRAAGGKIVLLQALGATPSVAELMTVGADQLIVKPIAPLDLLAALEGLWSESPVAFIAPTLTDTPVAA